MRSLPCAPYIGNMHVILSGSCCPQDFAAFLGILGPMLGELRMEHCWGDVITSESLRALWTCPNLRRLTLESDQDRIEPEDIEAGLQHLRSAGRTFSPHHIT